jgi:glucosamine-6-phosphate deaminase
VDVQLLGIGRNGHLGFNEPGSPFGSRTRVARLSGTTRADNARFFPRPEDVPTHCLTQGLGTILEASRLVLVASGSHKAAAVAAAVEGPVTESCPASVLQRHDRATVIADREAAAGLARMGDATPGHDWLH